MLPDDQIIHDLTLLYLNANMSSETTPEELKHDYFVVYRKIKSADAERWE